MKSLYIGSTGDYSGKTLVTMGLAMALQKQGFRVGYLKPLGRLPIVVEGEAVDGDAEFLKKILHLTDPLSLISPVVLTHELVVQHYKGALPDLLPKVVAAHAQVSRDKDLVLIGGAGNFMGGTFLDLEITRVCEALASQVLLVDSSDPQRGYDALFVAREILGDRLIGVILNRVSSLLHNMVEEMAIPFLTKSGFRILGVLPHDPLLDAITVGQLQELLDGKILCAADRLDELVANFSVGAMDLDKAMSYFRKLPNKAVITGANRPDLQLAALETATKCLILTGNQSPNEIIISRARELRVPIIVVPYDTFTTVDRVEHFMGRIRIREQQKVEKARQLLEERLDYRALLQALQL